MLQISWLSGKDVAAVDGNTDLLIVFADGKDKCCVERLTSGAGVLMGCHREAWP
jgi:hypothetical protein